MKHRFSFIPVAVALLVSAQAFASGTSESASTGIPWETVTVTGKVTFKDMPFPELTAGGKTYELVVPRYDVSSLGVKAGDTITVEGVLVSQPASTDGRLTLRVTKATIGGKEYVVPAYGRGTAGGRAGPRVGVDGGWDGSRGGGGARARR